MTPPTVCVAAGTQTLVLLVFSLLSTLTVTPEKMHGSKVVELNEL